MIFVLCNFCNVLIIQIVKNMFALQVLLGMSSDRLPNLPSLAEQAETETTENVKFKVPLLQVRYCPAGGILSILTFNDLL